MTTKIKFTEEAANDCIEYINYAIMNRNSSLSLEEMECSVREITKRRLDISIQQIQWEWGAITRQMIANMTSTTPNFHTFKKFCKMYPRVIQKLHATCGKFTDTHSHKFNFLEYNVAVGYHTGMIMSGKNQMDNMSRQKIIVFLSKNVNKYLSHAIIETVSPSTMENMMPSIVFETGHILHATDSTNLFTACTLLSMQIGNNAKLQSTAEILKYYNQYAISMWGLLLTTTPNKNLEKA